MAFVPGRAAFVDGRGGQAMRLNFSGVNEDEIREGIRRIGEVVREQVGLYEHAHRACGRRRRAEADTPRAGPQPACRNRSPTRNCAKVLQLPAKRKRVG